MMHELVHTFSKLLAILLFYFETPKKMTIRLGPPVVEGNILKVSIDAGDAAKYLNSGVFRAKYEGIDLDNVAPEILIIPALGSILTIAYAAGVSIDVPLVDSSFAVAAEELATVWNRLYPSFNSQNFKLTGRREASHQPTRKNDLLLYSGGIDALGSLLSNKASVDGLFTVWGADIPLTREDLWVHLNSVIKHTDATKNFPCYSAKTNLRKFPNNLALVTDFTGGASEGSWWMKAQHGISLISLAAPVSFAEGFSRVLLASSHSEQFNTAWGSSPETDNLVRWANVSVWHDGYNFTRQDKIKKLVSPHLRTGNKAEIPVCYNKKRGGLSINCGECEKCLRTVTGLLVTGINPEQFGLPVNISALKNWQNRLSSGSRKFSDNELFMWQDIQKGFDDQYLSETSPELRDYVDWVRSFNFLSVYKKT